MPSIKFPCSFRVDRLFIVTGNLTTFTRRTFMTFTKNFTRTFTAGLSRQDFHQDFHHVCVRPRSKTKHYMLTWGGAMLHFRGITCRIKRERTPFSISSHRQRIVTTKCIPQSTQTTHCHNQCMPQSPHPLQNKLRACSRFWTKRILVVHSVIKVIKCLSS